MSTGVARTGSGRGGAAEAGSFLPNPSAVAQTEPGGGTLTDGEPPLTTPNPPLVPLGGGCRSSLFGPSSCNWTVPVPKPPEGPDFNPPDFPMPGDHFPDMPVVKTNVPNFPELPCLVPDFGNMDPCGKDARGRGRGGGGGPGYNGPLPGARDRTGRQGNSAAQVKTAGQTYGKPRITTFGATTCPGQETPGIGCMAVITQLLMDVGINPIDIIFQIGPEWDKPFPPEMCFAKGSSIFAAAEWTARFIMCIIVDEGPPTNDVYIGPPWHRPGQTTWTFDEHYDLFALTRDFSGEEGYGFVEVFGPNITTPVIAQVDTPFTDPDSPILQVEVGANYSLQDAIDLAGFRASQVRREAVSIQAVVPYSSEYFLRDNMLLRAPDKGFQETYVITGKESDISPAGRLHILTGMLPATLAELDQFPEVTDEYSAVDGGFAE